MSSTSSSQDRPLTVLAVNKNSWLRPEPGGAERNLEETLKRVAERGHEVHVLTAKETGRPATEVDSDVTIHRTGFDRNFPSLLDLLVSYVTIATMYHLYQHRISPDVVYTVNTPLPWMIYASAPRVTIYHHIKLDTIFDTHPFPAAVFGYVMQRAGIFLDRGRPTVSVSPSTTETLVAQGHSPETVHEVRNGIEIEKYSTGAEADNPEILFVGALQKYKGADRIPAIHESVEELADSVVHLHVAGRGGSAADEVRDYCSGTDSATFHGYVSEAEKIHLLRRNWILIAPSRVEGWGIAVVEANACGTPAVGADVAGLRDSIRDGETGLLSDATNPEVFATDVMQLLETDDDRREMGSNARLWAEEHSWETAASELEALFQRTVQ